MNLNLKYSQFKGITFGVFFLFFVMNFYIDLQTIIYICYAIIFALSLNLFFITRKNLKLNKYYSVFNRDYWDEEETKEMEEKNSLNYFKIFLNIGLISLIEINSFYNWISFIYFLVLILAVGKRNIEYTFHEPKEYIKDNIKLIRETLKNFNKTSQFRIRVEKALLLIEDINYQNFKMFKFADTKTKEKIKEKRDILQRELSDISVNIVKYNNERNEELVISINSTIKILYKMLNQEE